MTVRYLEKFNNTADTVSYVFPLQAYEWIESQPMRTPLQALVGAHYAYDYLGTGVGIKDSGVEQIKFLDVQSSTANLESDLVTLRQKLWANGRGKLYTLDSGGTRLWSYARLVSMPQMTIAVGMQRHAAIAIDFRRESDWFASSVTTGSTSIVTTPTSWTWVNSGNAPVYAMTILIGGGGSGAPNAPTLTNNTNGYSYSTKRVGAGANAQIKVDTGANLYQYSTDSVNFANDYANFTRGANQVGVFRLEPGNNSITLTDQATPGTQNYFVSISFYAPWH